MLLSSSLGVKRDHITSSDIVYASRLDSKKSSTPNEVTESKAASGDYALKLTQEQIHKLSKAIVIQVKRRGPFPSVSAFLNRTLELDTHLRNKKVNENNSSSPYKDVRHSGALQEAIDQTKQINKALDSKKDINPEEFVDNVQIYPGVKSLRKSANSHLPGYLKQSDILRQIDPTITVRGDTFIIRTVGISKNKQGEIIAKAACEAIVQRHLEYIDSTQTTETPPYEITHDDTGIPTLEWKLTPLNRHYGRKFRIVSFQWLSSSEIARMHIKE